MHHDNPEQTPRRPSLAEREFLPADTLFVRLRHQTALLAASEALLRGDADEARWGLLLHDYAFASDRVVTVHGDAEAAILGWLKPRGIIALIATEECSDDLVVEHVAAALSAMNAVTLSIDEDRSRRLRTVVDTLSRLLPDAFAELPAGPSVHYPVGATAVVLTEGVLVRSWAPPVTLGAAAQDDDDRVEMLTLYGRVRQLDVRPE